MHCYGSVITSITWCITYITRSITSSNISLLVLLHDKYMLDYMPLHPAPFHYMLDYMIHYMPLHPNAVPAPPWETPAAARTEMSGYVR